MRIWLLWTPQRVTDRATFEKPAQYSEGIPYVMVNGTLVVKGGELVLGCGAGTGRAALKAALRFRGCAGIHALSWSIP